MKFLVISHVLHMKEANKIYAYGPYVREMNLWFKFVEQVKVLGPIAEKKIEPIDMAYKHGNLNLSEVVAFNTTSIIQILRTMVKLPILTYQVLKAMAWADHIHLRCPGNMGLIGVVVQILFPNKPKTAKYAGNWDPGSSQPWSYRFQKWLLSNTFLTRNMKVLVYGQWPNQTANIVPFFTASYHQFEIESIEKHLPILQAGMIAKEKSETIKLMFVGTLSHSKRPLLSIKVLHQLINMGVDVEIDVFGDGPERIVLEDYIKQHQLVKFVKLHGNQSSKTIKAHYKQAHFLIFISKSEGWPKVVAEAMFWGCLPITSNVSCINYMIADGRRGKIAKPDIASITKWVRFYLCHPDDYLKNSKDAQVWSQQYTLEKFENEIRMLLSGN